MKNYIFLISVIFCVLPNFGQDFQMPKAPSQDLDRGGNLQNSTIRDSLMSKFGDRSTKLNKNPDAKIEDYLIISRQNDTVVVDTSLTIEKYHRVNFLRKDNFDLIPFSNTGFAYNTLTFSPTNSINPKMGASNKYYAYDSVDDIVYYDLPTPFTELMYRSVFEQGQLLDAVYSVNTSRQFNFSISSSKSFCRIEDESSLFLSERFLLVEESLSVSFSMCFLFNCRTCKGFFNSL